MHTITFSSVYLHLQKYLKPHLLCLTDSRKFSYGNATHTELFRLMEICQNLVFSCVDCLMFDRFDTSKSDAANVYKVQRSILRKKNTSFFRKLVTESNNPDFSELWAKNPPPKVFMTVNQTIGKLCKLVLSTELMA